MQKAAPSDSAGKQSKFYCGPEWHLGGLALRIYCLAWRLSKKSGKFNATAGELAAHFVCDECSVYRAIQKLLRLGFFVLLEKGLFESNVYRVVPHKEWAEAHAEQCTVKETFPWSPGNDKLGSDLHALSGGRVRFLPFQIQAIRKFGFPENEVKEHFAAYLATVDLEKRRKRRYVPGRFILWLRQFRRPKYSENERLRGRAKALRDSRLGREMVDA